MLHALTAGGVYIQAADAQEDDGPFQCAYCKEPVVKKWGLVRVAHFAHQPYSTCPYALSSNPQSSINPFYSQAGESELHKMVKRDILLGLKSDPKCATVDLEYTIDGKRRGDVVFTLQNGHMVAVEIQVSNTEVEEIAAKLRDYYQAGVSCIYVLPRNIPSGSYSAPVWIRYLHSMAFNSLFFYFQEHEIRAIRLQGYKAEPGQTIKNETFFAQQRPVITYNRKLLLTDLVSIHHRDEDIGYRHLGVTDALMWTLPFERWREVEQHSQARWG